LRGLLADYFDGIPVEILEFTPRQVELPERPCLGSDADVQIWAAKAVRAKLGDNVVLGEKLLDYAGKFRVALGPLTLEMYRTFLPGGANEKAVYALTQFYAPDRLDFDVELKIKAEDIPTPLQLGGELAQLSRTAWLGRPKGQADSVLLRRRVA
jgi:predicted component of type VI protein secretion system